MGVRKSALLYSFVLSRFWRYFVISGIVISGFYCKCIVWNQWNYVNLWVLDKNIPCVASFWLGMNSVGQPRETLLADQIRSRKSWRPQIAESTPTWAANNASWRPYHGLPTNNMSSIRSFRKPPGNSGVRTKIQTTQKFRRQARNMKKSTQKFRSPPENSDHPEIQETGKKYEKVHSEIRESTQKFTRLLGNSVDCPEIHETATSALFFILVGT